LKSLVLEEWAWVWVDASKRNRVEGEIHLQAFLMKMKMTSLEVVLEEVLVVVSEVVLEVKACSIKCNLKAVASGALVEVCRALPCQLRLTFKMESRLLALKKQPMMDKATNRLR